jgi:outer membrane protein assembly factor BamB
MPCHRALLLALGLGACSRTTAEDSPASAMFRGGADHTGVYPATIGPELNGLEWRFDTDGAVVGSPVVLGDTLWIGSGDGSVHALRVGTGEVIWRVVLESPVAATAAVAGGMLIVGTRDGAFRGLASASGAERWIVRTGHDVAWPWGHESGDRYTASPAIAGREVILAAGDGSVRAVALDSGRERWRVDLHTRLRSSPAASAGKVFLGGADGKVYALDLATGAIKWSYATHGTTLASGDFGYDRRTIMSSPAVAGGTVYIGARDGFLYALNAESGSLVWKFDHEISWVISSPAVQDSMVYAGTSDGLFVQAVDTRTGLERWRHQTDITVWSSPVISGDLLVYGDSRGRIVALDRWSGTERWSFTTGGGVYGEPVPAGRRLLAGSLDGGVYAICTGEGSPVTRAVWSGRDGGAPDSAASALAAQLVARGYTRVDDDGLVAALTAAIADNRSTTVVFASDDLPETMSKAPLDRSLLARYLAAGGKVVWTGVPPLLWPRDSVGRRIPSLKAITWERPAELLGVGHAATMFDRRMVRTTAAGRRWGLTGRWRDSWAVDAREVSETLGIDDWGLAAAWVRNYGGPPGTGFARVSAHDPQAVYLAAEYRPGCS